jgi:hypothetical protein
VTDTDTDAELSAREAYAAALQRAAEDPSAWADFQVAARAWREIDVDDDGWTRPAPERVLRAVRQLAAQAQTHIGRASGRRPLHAALRWVSRGRFGRERGWPVIPDLGTPWQDTVSAERPGFRQRAAYLHGDHVFGMDYHTCRRCGLGWVEQPYTEEPFRRCGVAAAALAALRAEYPGLSWHTLGGHFQNRNHSGPMPPGEYPAATANATCARTRPVDNLHSIGAG